MSKKSNLKLNKISAENEECFIFTQMNSNSFTLSSSVHVMNLKMISWMISADLKQEFLEHYDSNLIYTGINI